MRRSLLLGMLVLLLGAEAARAQPDPAGLLAAMRDAYGRLDYDTAEQRAREALALHERLSADHLVETHVTLGLILYARNEPIEAREQFEAALSLAPNLRLDPLLVSPKTIAFFEEIRGDVEQSGTGARSPVIRYVRVHDPRPAAALRSLAVPGWGQLYKGEAVKGWALVGVWGAAAGGTLVAHFKRQSAEEAYLAARDPQEIQDRYDDFNRWHKARGALALGLAAVWTYATLDALVLGGPEIPEVGAFELGPVPAGEAVGLGLRVRF